MPTLKRSLGVDLDGHSLRPLLLKSGKWNMTGPPVALSMVSSRMGDIPGNKNFAVRSREWRYIRYENGMEELYNHADDPYEFTNLITSSDPAVWKSINNSPESYCRWCPNCLLTDGI